MLLLVVSGSEFIFVATDGQDFRDTSSFYRFTADDVLFSTGRRGTQLGREFIAKQSQSCITLTVSSGRSVVLKGLKCLFLSVRKGLKCLSPSYRCPTVERRERMAWC